MERIDYRDRLTEELFRHFTRYTEESCDAVGDLTYTLEGSVELYAEDDYTYVLRSQASRSRSNNEGEFAGSSHLDVVRLKNGMPFKVVSINIDALMIESKLRGRFNDHEVLQDMMNKIPDTDSFEYRLLADLWTLIDRAKASDADSKALVGAVVTGYMQLLDNSEGHVRSMKSSSDDEVDVSLEWIDYYGVPEEGAKTSGQFKKRIVFTKLIPELGMRKLQITERQDGSFSYLAGSANETHTIMPVSSAELDAFADRLEKFKKLFPIEENFPEQ